MAILKLLFIIILSFIDFNSSLEIENNSYPNVLIVILVRNKAHTLPYFLSYLEDLDYPKDRIVLWLRSDHNEDNSIQILNKWLKKVQKSYKNVNINFENKPKSYKNKTILWPHERYEHLINLKEEALTASRKDDWTDFIFYLDADVFLTNRITLKELILFNLPVIAPILKSESFYSNFWHKIDEDYYFEETLEYSEIYERHEINNFKVPVVYSAVLINLKDPTTKWLTFSLKQLHENQMNHNHITRKYDGPFDDVIIFSMSANYFEIDQYISNIYEYGYIITPLEDNQNLNDDLLLLENIKILMIYNLEIKPKINKELENFVKYPEPHKLTFDHIYMINLKRRPERKAIMELQFKEMGMIVERFEAVDGREINIDELDSMGVKILPNYEDPLESRKIKVGEIGCFLSHYNIWKKIVELEQKEVLILEDDIRFYPFFRTNAVFAIEQARKITQWDLLYLGRKILQPTNENWANYENTLVFPGWTYWTMAYAITLEGAKKLIAAKPLEKILPVDEFIPIMFNQHPNNTWKSYFEKRNLLALSVKPLILEPAYERIDERYISDTESSIIIEENVFDDNVKIHRDEF